MQWRSFSIAKEGKSYAIGRDINDRKEAELRSQQLAALVEFSADAIIGVGRDHVIKSWNRGAVSIFGYQHSQAEGLPVSQLFEHEFYGRLAEAGLSGADKDGLCVRADGSRFCASLLVSDVLDHDHLRVGYSVIIRNITERKEMETRVKEFYSTVSHELRTPLTSIRGALALISGGIIELNSPEALDLVNVAQESSLRLIRLINDILDIQKIESGNLVLAKTIVSPGELLRKTINETAGMAEAMGILLTTNCDKDLANLSVDVDKIVQVLTNLVSNAIKFSPDGEKVGVDVRRTDQSIRFSVRDRGCGIPEDQSHRLFQKFRVCQ